MFSVNVTDLQVNMLCDSQVPEAITLTLIPLMTLSGTGTMFLKLAWFSLIVVL